MNSCLKASGAGLLALLFSTALFSQVLKIEIVDPLHEATVGYAPQNRQATAYAVLGGGEIKTITVDNKGAGYLTPPTVTITGDGTGASASATLNAVDGSISAITVTSGGSGYTSRPSVVLTGGSPTAVAMATASDPTSIGLSRIVLADRGLGYAVPPTITLEGGGGIGASAVASLSSQDGMISSITVTNPGMGYLTAPSVVISAPGGVVVIKARITGTPPLYGTSFFVGDAKVGQVDDHLSNEVSASWTPPQPGSYFLTASTKDELGNTATSLPIRIFVSGTSIISPITGTLIPEGSSVVVSAEATPAKGLIKKVEFFADGGLIGGDETAPYTCPFTPPSKKPYILTAVATDNEGRTMVASAPVAVDVITRIGSLPTIDLSYPAKAAVGDEVTLLANAADVDGRITKVEFYVDGDLVETRHTVPYEAKWTPKAAGDYELSAIAFDDKSNAVISNKKTLTVVLEQDPNDDSSDASDSYYTGTTADGKWTLNYLQNADGNGLLIANSQNDRSLLFPDIVVSNGAFRATATNGIYTVEGNVNTTGMSGTLFLSGVSTPFIIPVTLSTGSLTQTPGLYSGSLTGRLGSSFHAILHPSRAMTVHLSEDDHYEGGSVFIETNGKFTMTLSGGTTLEGSIDSESGYLSATATGTLTGTLRAALVSGSKSTDSSLHGISTRALVGTGNRVLIAGFIVSSGDGKQVMLRGLGKSLEGLVPGTLLGNPLLESYQATATGAVARSDLSNDNWTGTAEVLAAMSRLQLASPKDTLEAMALGSANNGAYTAILKDAAGATGIGLVQIYDPTDFTASMTPRLSAISSRGYVGTGNDALIAGVSIRGNLPMKVLFRCVGPGLPAAAVGASELLADPVISVYEHRGDQTVLIRENDNWEVGNGAGIIRTTTASLGLTPPLTAGSKDSAMLLRLRPGSYTVVVHGRNNSTGIALVEIYEVK